MRALFVLSFVCLRTNRTEKETKQKLTRTEMGAFGLFIFWIGIEWSFSRVTNFRAGASFHGSIFGHYDGNFDGFNDNDGEKKRLEQKPLWLGDCFEMCCFFLFYKLIFC